MISIFEMYNGYNDIEVFNNADNCIKNCNDISLENRRYVLQRYELGCYLILHCDVKNTPWRYIKSRIQTSLGELCNFAVYMILRIMKRNGCDVNQIVQSLNEIHSVTYKLKSPHYYKGDRIYICKCKCMTSRCYNYDDPAKCTWCKNDITETIVLV